MLVAHSEDYRFVRTTSLAISSSDKAKLDAHLTCVRERGKRVEGMRKNKDKASGAPPLFGINSELRRRSSALALGV